MRALSYLCGLLPNGGEDMKVRGRCRPILAIAWFKVLLPYTTHLFMSVRHGRSHHARIWLAHGMAWKHGNPSGMNSIIYAMVYMYGTVWKILITNIFPSISRESSVILISSKLLQYYTLLFLDSFFQALGSVWPNSSSQPLRNVLQRSRVGEELEAT